MNENRGLAYCGLACCLCADTKCPGCRADGCKDRDWCKNYRCCREKQISGCWQCHDFPCSGSMLDKVRVRAFAQFVKAHGEEEMIRCLKRNEQDGLVYHYPDQLIGDYDAIPSEQEIFRLLLEGRR